MWHSSFIYKGAKNCLDEVDRALYFQIKWNLLDLLDQIKLTSIKIVVICLDST